MASSSLCTWCSTVVQGTYPWWLRSKEETLPTINNRPSVAHSVTAAAQKQNRLFALGAKPLARLTVKSTSNYSKLQAFEMHRRVYKRLITTAPNHSVGKWILTLVIVINTQLGVNYTVHIFTTHLFPTSFGTTSKLAGFVHWFPTCHFKTRTGILAMRQKAAKKKERKSHHIQSRPCYHMAKEARGTKLRRKNQGPPSRGRSPCGWVCALVLSI